MPGPKAPQISLSPDERQGLAGLIPVPIRCLNI